MLPIESFNLFFQADSSSVFILPDNRIHADRIIHSVPVISPRNGEGKSGRAVGRTFHLVCIPASAQIHQVADTCIGAYVFHFSAIPQWEGFVVTVDKQNGVSFLLQCVQVILSHVMADHSSAAVVVIPCLACHLQGNQDSHYSGQKNGSRRFQFPFQQSSNAGNSHSGPDGKSIK